MCRNGFCLHISGIVCLSLLMFNKISPIVTTNINRGGSQCDDIEWNNTLIDISHLFKHDFNQEVFQIEKLAKCITLYGGQQRPMLFYETDLDQDLELKLQPIIDWTVNLTSNDLRNDPKIVLSLRYNLTDIYGAYSVPKYLLENVDRIQNLTSITMISLDYTLATKVCAPDYFTTYSYPFLSHLKLACPNCSKIKFGYTVRHDHVRCNVLGGNIAAADFIIVRIYFSPNKNFPGSFSIFKKYLDKTLQGIIPAMSENGKVESTFYQVQFKTTAAWGLPNDMGITVGEVMANLNSAKTYQLDTSKTLMVDKQYGCLFNKYVQEWRKSDKSNLVQAFSTDWEFCNSLQDNKPSTFLIPHIQEQFKELDPIRGDGCTYFLSIMLSMKDIYNDGFHSVTMKADRWAKVVKFANLSLQECGDRLGYNSTLAGQVNLLNLTILFNPVSSVDIQNIKFSTAPIAEYFGFNKPKYSCIVPILLYGLDASHQKLLDDVCDEISLQLELKFDLVTHLNYQNDIPFKLAQDYFLGQSIIKSRWPNKTGITLISVTELKPGVLPRESLYCNAVSATLSEYFEVIFNWADIHRIAITPDSNHLGFPSFPNPIQWQRIFEEGSSYRGLNVELPLYLRRGYSESRILNDWAEGLYPCLEWLAQVPAEPGFSTGQPGTYFKLDIRSNNVTLQEQEIFTMLLFSLSTFSMTMIEVKNLNEMKLILLIVTGPDFKQSMDENSIDKREIFFDIKLSSGKSHNRFFTMLRNLFTNITLPSDHISLRFHFSNLLIEDVANSVLDYSHNVGLNETIEIGIQIDNCKDIIQQFAQIQEHNIQNIILSKQKISKLLETSSYIVCIIPSMAKVNPSKPVMQTYFQTHLYIKTLLQFLFPNLKKVYFSMLPSQGSETEEVKELLLFLSHTAQFGSVYNILYFLLPAFTPEISNHIGWWMVHNYTNLEDTSIYTDIHSEYTQRRPWRPILLPRENPGFRNAEVVKEPADPFWLIFGLVAASLLVFSVVALTLIVIKARRNAHLLSDEEVQEFLKGRKENLNLNDGSNDYNGQVVGIEYNSEYEISKNDLCILHDQILGAGNFGIVYKATMNSSRYPITAVAVKMPRECCDRQTFIGMLREVKLLGYMGSHQNVVAFVGSYTKEIRKGILNIVLEYCSGGNLISHLRKLKSDQSHIGQDVIFSDLIRFSRDIASGMQYISNKNVIHGDLSARNVLLNDINVCKISDFGLGRKLYQYRTYSKKTQEPLPWRWMSYESLKDLQFSTMSDVWSFGITIWEIFSLGDVPYPGQGWTTEFVTELKQGTRMTSPDYATIEIYKKMAECWTLEPNQRPEFTDLFTFFVDLLPYTDLY